MIISRSIHVATNELIYNIAIDSHLEHELMVNQGEGGGWVDSEFGMDIHTLLYLKQITNNVLLYSTENSAHYSVIT